MGYAAFIIHVASSHGGHIGKDGVSLCGVEKRFPHNETEEGIFEDDFKAWIKSNEFSVCQSCMRIYRAREKSL